MEKAFDVIYEIVRQIPKGRVCTYGGIARLAGNPRWARIVGYAMRACRDETVPCHRVLHKDGTLCQAFESGGRNLQADLLLREGVRFLPNGKADLAHFSRRLDETEETKYAEQNKWFHGGENARGRKNHGRSFILSGRS